MDPSTWIALIAVVVAVLGPLISSIAANARRDGKLDAAIERLTAITVDHEARLRKGHL